MPITALPTPPTRTDAANFNSRAEAFLSALPSFATEANTLASDVTSKQTTASTAATTASTAATTASTAATTASTAATTAGTHATNANASYLLAKDFAEKTDGVVTGTSYSSKYWAQIAQGFVVGTLFDNSNLSNTKAFTNQFVYDNYIRSNGTNAFSGQILSFKSNSSPDVSANYSIKTAGSYGGGYVMVDGVHQISMYSSYGDLKFGFGSEGNIANKFTIFKDGSFEAAAAGTIRGTLSVNTSLVLNDTTGSGTTVSSTCTGKSPVNLYNYTNNYGLFSSDGGNLVHYNRASGKRFFADIAEDDIWKFSQGSFNTNPNYGYCRLPNGLIFQWGKFTGGDGTKTITFPMYFTNACFGVFASYHGGSAWPDVSKEYIYDITQSGFSAQLEGTGLIAGQWFAIGW